MARPCSRRRTQPLPQARTQPLPQVVEEAQRANAPLGVALSARPEGVMQLCEEPAKRVEVAAAERAGPVVPDLSDELTRDRLRLSAPRCQANELGASVVRIWDPFDVAEPLEVVDQVDDARLCDLR